MAPKRRKASAGTRGASEERPEKADGSKGKLQHTGRGDGCFQESHIQRTEQMKSACKYTYILI